MRQLVVLLLLVPMLIGQLVSRLAADDVSSTKPAPAKPKSVIVVRPAAWADAIASWKSYRQKQGHEVLELDAELGRAGVQSAIVRMTQAAQKRHESQPAASLIGYVLLIGDGDQGTDKVPLLPAWYRRSTAMVKFGGDELLATDNPYADIDAMNNPI